MDVQGQKILDEKLCWDLWIKPGVSLPKVQSELERRGVISRKTGRPPTIQAIERAAYRYLCDAPKNVQDECRKQYEYCMTTMQARTVSDEEWKQWIVEKARLAYHQRSKKFEEFIARNGLQAYVRGVP